LELRYVKKLARCAVRARGVEHEFAALAHDFGNEPRKLGNRYILAAADIERRRGGIALEHRRAGIGEVIA